MNNIVDKNFDFHFMKEKYFKNIQIKNNVELR
jgi:hypothetical protein